MYTIPKNKTKKTIDTTSIFDTTHPMYVQYLHEKYAGVSRGMEWEAKPVRTDSFFLQQYLESARTRAHDVCTCE